MSEPLSFWDRAFIAAIAGTSADPNIRSEKDVVEFAERIACRASAFRDQHSAALYAGKDGDAARASLKTRGVEIRGTEAAKAKEAL